MNEALELSGVSVGYGDHLVLDDVSFTVPDPDLGAADSRKHSDPVSAPHVVTAVLGDSGSGKSTLLRAIAGLEPLRGGEICFGGAQVGHAKPHRRGFGMVFQDAQLFPHLSVAANIGYGANLAGQRPDRARIAAMLELVGLSGFGDRSVRTLSGGQAQRVALARALAPRPRALLLDEPMSALDVRLKEGLLRDLPGIIGATPTLLVTHDHREAARLAQQILVLDGGRVIARDRPDRLWRNPPTVAAAAVLGYGFVVPGDSTLLGPADYRSTAADLAGDYRRERALVAFAESALRIVAESTGATDGPAKSNAEVLGMIAGPDGPRWRIRFDSALARSITPAGAVGQPPVEWAIPADDPGGSFEAAAGTRIRVRLRSDRVGVIAENPGP